MHRLIASALTCALLAGVANAQTRATTPTGNPASDPGVPVTPLPQDRGDDKPSARVDAINAPNRAELANANSTANVASVQNQGSVNANAQAVYDMDMANYMTALRAHDARSAANDALYAAKRRAYAEAMHAWRVQVYDCSRGVMAACRAPTPDPAAFY